ncbi:hypothetical protein L596_003872 [Steinernema carpocapsae]|uniref:Uncharacterized protein n=1 Tax=Steinernema carpocapsae TaxID=34508 RepID=A0A4U8UTU2_STECR|nr:hypothetical protein L596_003872 [Steinernema carpocapsae]
MLRDIPNLDELTEGMDLSLLNRPGGFAQLKQQFIERLLRRNMGLPVSYPLSRTTLPPPIVPVKITRQKQL